MKKMSISKRKLEAKKMMINPKQGKPKLINHPPQKKTKIILNICKLTMIPHPTADTKTTNTKLKMKKNWQPQITQTNKQD